MRGQFISVRRIVGRKIDSKCGRRCFTHRNKISTDRRFVRVGEAAATAVSFYNLSERGRVDVIATAGQVSGLIVSPELPARHPSNIKAQVRERVAALACVNVRPVKPQRAGLRVTLRK